jgi:Domain of unknown function (DUF5658)
VHYDASRKRGRGSRFKVIAMNSPLGSRSARGERRGRLERRRRHVWSVWYGSFNPRRRAHPRRADDMRFHSLDWYSAHLLAVAIGISMLSMADAFLTLTLLNSGADEINPVMAALLEHGALAFTACKMAMTGVCVVALVVMSRHRFLRLIRVEIVMYIVLVSYAGLIAYELSLLHRPWDAMIL